MDVSIINKDISSGSINDVNMDDGYNSDDDDIVDLTGLSKGSVIINTEEASGIYFHQLVNLKDGESVDYHTIELNNHSKACVSFGNTILYHIRISRTTLRL